MNKKGFTLVELLAVIVILGIIMVIAVPNLIKTRQSAAKQEAIKMEKMIEDLGPAIYMDEKNKDSSNFMTKWKSNKAFYIDIIDLIKAGYLKGDKSQGIESPYNNGYCVGYLLINASHEFKSYIDCQNGNTDYYKNSDYDGTNHNGEATDNTKLEYKDSNSDGTYEWE